MKMINKRLPYVSYRSVHVAMLALVLLVGMTGFSGASVSAASSTAAVCDANASTLQTQLENGRSSSIQEDIHFTDTDFLSQTTGRVAGNGFLIGTSDGGCHWQKIYTGTWQFSQIEFSSNTQGWALASAASGQKPVFLTTTDGGATWKKPYNGNLRFTKIDKQSGSTGFAYTTSGVYKTINGGAAWTVIPTPANTRGGYFQDSNTGWVIKMVSGSNSGYRIMQTIDGGSKWTTALSVGSLEVSGGEIYANGKQVWAILYGGAGMSQVSYSVYASSDSGQSWRQVFGQSTAGGGKAPGTGALGNGEGPAQPGGHPGNMQFIGSTIAYLAGGSPAGGKVAVGRSLDGGKTWNNMPATIDGISADISFLSQNVGYLTVTDSLTPSIYMTKDGGKTWSAKLKWVAADKQ